MIAQPIDWPWTFKAWKAYQGFDDGVVAPVDDGRDLLLLADAGHEAVLNDADPQLFYILQLVQDLREQLVVVLALEVVGLDEDAGVLALDGITVGVLGGGVQSKLLKLVPGHAAVQVGLLVEGRRLLLLVQGFPEFFPGEVEWQLLKKEVALRLFGLLTHK